MVVKKEGESDLATTVVTRTKEGKPPEGAETLTNEQGGTELNKQNLELEQRKKRA